MTREFATVLELRAAREVRTVRAQQERVGLRGRPLNGGHRKRVERLLGEGWTAERIAEATQYSLGSILRCIESLEFSRQAEIVAAAEAAG